MKAIKLIVCVMLVVMATACRSNAVSSSTDNVGASVVSVGASPVNIGASTVSVATTTNSDSSVIVGGHALTVIQSPENGVLCNSPATAVPKAVVYRVNGSFVDNVPVTMSMNRQKIVSFPAPSDITESSRPIQLIDGYLLDRRGISANSVFTKYSYKEYGELKSAPSLSELRDMVIPGAIVTDFVRLPFTLSVAVADTARVNELIRTGFPGCTVVISNRRPGPYLK
jgi:hypothetical protein